MADNLLLLFRAQVVGTYSDSATSIELSSVTRLDGQVPINLVLYNKSTGNPVDAYETGEVEILRVTAVDTGTSTITVQRAQEGTTAIAINSDVWEVYQSVTPKTLGDKVSKSNIVDDLTSTDTDKPLSANQGKVLNEKIKILQVAQVQTTTTVINASINYVDTGLEASMIPISASSRIMCLISMSYVFQSPTSPQGMAVRILRAGVNLYTLDRGGNLDGGGVIFADPDSNPLLIGGGVFNYSFLDSPSTTSSITYKVQFKPKGAGTGQSAQVQSGNQLSTIILMEVA